jgi:hypothetical protein
VSDYVERHQLGRRADFDVPVSVILDLDPDRNRCLGMEVTPSTGAVQYVLTDEDGVETKYLSFEKAFKHYQLGAGRRCAGLHLCH